MKTPQILERKIFGGVVRQNHKTRFYNAKDIELIGNHLRRDSGLPPKQLARYFQINESMDFIEVLKADKGLTEVVVASKGRNGGTYVHPLLFVDIALWFSPKLKIAVYEWLMDNLEELRDECGDNFKDMNIALDNYYQIGSKYYIYSNVARMIKKAVGVADWNTANENQLKLRERIHDEIIYLCESSSNIPLNNLIPRAITRHIR